MDMVEYEYTVQQKCEGKWRLFKWGMLLFYVVFAVAYFLIIYTTRIFTLGALIPLFLWILIYFTWKYVKPEYKYVISDAHLTFYKIYGKTQKEKLHIKICEAEYIIPLEESLDEIQQLGPKNVYSALPSKSSNDSYIIIFKGKDGTSSAFMFKATEKALKALKFYNKNTVITHTEV